MATLADVKKTMKTLINFIPSNVNYLKNLVTSVSNANSASLYELNFELQVNIIVVNSLVDLTRQVYDITSVELHIFFSETNNHMEQYIYDGLDFVDMLEEMLFITEMLIELYEMMWFMEEGSMFDDDNPADDMLSPFTDYINMFAERTEKLLEIIVQYYNMINI